MNRWIRDGPFILRAGEGGGGGGGRVEFVWTNNVLTKLVKDPVLFNLELTSNFEMTSKFYNLGNQQ